MLLQKINNCFKDLIFDEKEHKYFYKGKELESVTKFISKFKPFVDFDLIAFRKALKENKTIEEIKEDWNNTKKQGIDVGNSVHNFAETDLSNPKTKRQKYLKEYLEEYLKDKEVIGKEVRISNLENLAGTFDVLLKRKKDNKLELVDYKTNKNLFKSYGNLEKPFSNLPNNSFSIYIIQLNLYALMLEKICNIKIDYLTLLWVTEYGVTKYEIPKIKNISEII